MKIKEDFIYHESDEESMLIPTGDADFSGIVKGNKTLGIIMDLMKEDTTEDEIVARMKERFDAPEDVIRADVRTVIANLSKIGALD